MTSTSSTLLLSDRIHSSLQRLRSDTSYLGDPNVHSQLTWYRSVHADVNAEVDTGHTDAYLSGSEFESQIPPPPIATLSAIVILTDEDFWLSSDGFWEESTSRALSITDVTLTCTGADPRRHELRGHFNNVIANVIALVGRLRTNTHCKKHVRVMSAITLEPKIKFQHRLFEVSARHDGCTSTTLENRMLILGLAIFRNDSIL